MVHLLAPALSSWCFTVICVYLILLVACLLLVFSMVIVPVVSDSKQPLEHVCGGSGWSTRAEMFCPRHQGCKGEYNRSLAC